MLWIFHLMNPLVLAISQGTVRVIRGKAPTSILRTAQEVVDLTGLRSGCLYKDPQGRWGFSVGMPPEVRQRFRNALVSV